MGYGGWLFLRVTSSTKVNPRAPKQKIVSATQWSEHETPEGVGEVSHKKPARLGQHRLPRSLRLIREESPQIVIPKPILGNLSSASIGYWFSNRVRTPQGLFAQTSFFCPWKGFKLPFKAIYLEGIWPTLKWLLAVSQRISAEKPMIPRIQKIYSYF